MEKKKKLIVLGVILLIIVISGITYAILTWNSTMIKLGINTNCFTIDYTRGGDITGSLKLLNINELFAPPLEGSDNPQFTIKKGMGLSYVNVGINSNCSIEGYGTIYLNVTELSDTFKDGGESNGALGYAVLKNTSNLSNSDITIDNLENQSFEVLNIQPIMETGKIELYSEQLSNTEVNKYLVVIFVDKLSAGNDITEATFKGNISVEADQKNKKKLANYIANDMFNPNTTVKSNNINYKYDIKNNLMEDIDGNIRYYGASPNNYIYFNCDDYSNQTSSTCETWRIIGVFEGKVKIMRGSQIGTYAWDNKNVSTGAESAYGKNDWGTARLMKLLNPSDYYEVDSNDNGNGQSLYWNSQSGTCFAGQNNATKACDFTSTGIKNDTTRNMISESMWYLRGYNSNSVYSDQIYEYERTKGSVYSGRPTSWKGKIALAYPSDYGYAADLSQCSQTLVNYDNSTCTSNNWMKSIITNNGGNVGWLLTPGSGDSDYAWFVDDSGHVNYGGNTYAAYGSTPVLYLGSELEIKAGDGKSDSPYQLSA